MPDAANRPTDLIIGASLVTAEAIAQELRSRLINRLTKRRKYSQWELLTIARNLLREYEPILAENLMNADLASWIAGVDAVVKRMPGQSLAAFLRGGGGPTPPMPPLSSLMGDNPGGEPIVRFPMLEQARQSLLERNIVTRAQFDKLTAEAKQRAFTVSYIDAEDTVDKIREALADTIQEGPSLRVFRENLEEAVGKSPIGPAHLENVYRTGVQVSFRDGFETISNHPIIGELFPFREYLPIRDARARPEHVALGSLGLDGTGVYWASDPMWDYFSAPWSWNCRCGTNALTVDAAARKGVRAAKEWLRTGQEPAVREYRLNDIPFRPDPKFAMLRGARRLAA